MKPQSRMLTRLHRPVATAAEAPAAVRSAALDPQAAFDRQVALKQALDRTLSETRAARSKRGVPTRLERLRKKLASVGTEPPGVPNPGELAVRVVGSRGTRNARVLPLGGMRVELGLDGGGRTALAAVTDASGYARFAVPEGEEPESYELRALAPDGKPVAVRSGRWSAEKGQRLRLEVGFASSLGPYFTAGERWDAGVQRALKRLEGLEEQLRPLLDRHVEGAEALAKRLGDAIRRAARDPGARRRDGGTTVRTVRRTPRARAKNGD